LLTDVGVDVPCGPLGDDTPRATEVVPDATVGGVCVTARALCDAATKVSDARSTTTDPSATHAHHAR
jgi:hypothetical protein